MLSATLSGGLLNPDLNVSVLGEQLDQQGWVVIENALRSEVAEALHEVLSKQVRWSLAYRDTEGAKKKWAEELATLSTTELKMVRANAIAQARKGFSFYYETYMMITAYQEQRDPELPLHRVTEYINQPEWLNFMRAITGEKHIIKTSAQATRYRAGDYLTEHNDSKKGESRYAAYVINLSKNWQADWGGLLQFIGPNKQVTDTILPQFNTISLFKTPVPHCVSSVAEFVTAERLSITGWLRGVDK